MRYRDRYTTASLMMAATLSCPAAVLAEVPTVVADLPAIHSLVAQVMGELGTPELLLEKGASPHGFTLRPSQVRAVSAADLIFWTGPEIAPWLDRVLQSGDTDASALGLLDAPRTHLRPYVDADGEGHEDHEGEASHDQHEGEAVHDDDEAGHDDHEDEANHDDHGTIDPHAWLDPGNALVWLPLIAAELSRVDPDNAAAYAANAATAAQSVQTLDGTLASRLTPFSDRPFFVFHDAFGYFVDHYGLTPPNAFSLGDATAPGAARLADLRAKAGNNTASCIFPEQPFDAALVTQLADETGLRIGGALDPEGLTLDPGPGLYAALLTGLADTIADCLQASAP